MQHEKKQLIEFLEKLALHFQLTNKHEEYLLLRKILIYLESVEKVGKMYDDERKIEL